MLENFFGPKSPEKKEEILRRTAREILKHEVNQASIYLALEALKRKAKELNKKAEGEPLDITNNFLINIVEDEALLASSAIEDALYGGAVNTDKLIQAEIESLRRKAKTDGPTNYNPQ